MTVLLKIPISLPFIFSSISPSLYPQSPTNWMWAPLGWARWWDMLPSAVQPLMELVWDIHCLQLSSSSSAFSIPTSSSHSPACSRADGVHISSTVGVCLINKVFSDEFLPPLPPPSPHHPSTTSAQSDLTSFQFRPQIISPPFIPNVFFGSTTVPCCKHPPFNW